MDAFTNHEMETQYIRFCMRGLEVRTYDDFKAWLENLGQLFPHEILIGVLGHVQSDGILASHVININLPIEYVDLIKNSNCLLSGPTVLAWIKEQEPQLAEFTDSQAYPGDWATVFRTDDLRNTASHGAVDLDGRMVTYFSFHRIPGRLGAQHAKVLKLLMPHMHLAFSRVVRTSQTNPIIRTMIRPLLKQSEVEILRWLTQGKSNWEISKISDRSFDAVKHDVSKVLGKLGVRTRIQAVAKAIDLGLVAHADEWRGRTEPLIRM